MQNNEWEKVCPFCKSPKITVDKTNYMVTSGIIRGYVCVSCQRSFTAPLEISKQKEE